MTAKLVTKQPTPPIAIDHIADYYRRYPGETVTFQTRIHVRRPLSGARLTVSLPAGLIVGAYQSVPQGNQGLPEMTFRSGAYHLSWRLDQALPAGTTREYQVQARVSPTPHELTLESRAVVIAEASDGETVSAEEWVAVAVSTKSDYLEYLPALYEQDELMGRFLMIFESFWHPLEGQIEELPAYIDPHTTPPDFLPWLASWLNLVLDDRWPEERRRRLLGSAVSLYRKRGTKQGLSEYLEIYTGQPVRIIEHRAKNFQLGQTKFGPGVALGKNNRPHTFTVTVPLPADQASGADTASQARREAAHRRMIEAILEAEKPAHTDYILCIETTTQ